MKLALTVTMGLVLISLTVSPALGAARPNTPRKSLCQAASDGDLPQVRLHLANSANLSAPDADGNTPLACAIEAGQSEVAQLLVDSGADLNGRSRQGMPLYIAARGGHVQIVELLLAKRAEVNASGGAVGTALHGAAAMGQKEIVELLLAKGADVNARTTNGITPLAAADLMGQTEVAAILRQQQAAAPLDGQRSNLYRQRGPYETMMPTEGGAYPSGAYAQPGNTLDVLSDPNAIRQSVASFPGLTDALAALDVKSKLAQRSWQQRRVDNRTSLLRTVDKQFADELALVKTTAQQESAAETVKAIDDLVTKRQERYDAISDALREERRAALQAEREAARNRGRSGTMTSGRRGRGRDMATTETTTFVDTGAYYSSATRDPNAPALDPDTESQLQAWLAVGAAEDKQPVLQSVTDTDLRELGSLREVALAEQAKQTSAVIAGLMLAHQEQRARVLQRIADDEERHRRLEERAGTRGTMQQDATEMQGRGRRSR